MRLGLEGLSNPLHCKYTPAHSTPLVNLHRLSHMSAEGVDVLMDLLGLPYTLQCCSSLTSVTPKRYDEETACLP